MYYLNKSGRPITFIDLFAGAGGLSEGFVSCGFKPIAHVEMNRHACDTLQTRGCYHWLHDNNDVVLYHKYLKGIIDREQLFQDIPGEILDSVICEEMSDATMPGIFQRIDKSIEVSGANHVDLIIGGPPCQAYSIVGRGRKDMSQDPRNLLYKQYISVLERYQPKMFVFENVPGLLSAGDGEYLKLIRTAFEENGYKLDFKVQDASDFGVLQRRKRMILVIESYGSAIFKSEMMKGDPFYKAMRNSRVKIMHIKKRQEGVYFDGNESLIYAWKIYLLYRSVCFSLMGIDVSLYASALDECVNKIDAHLGIVDHLMRRL